MGEIMEAKREKYWKELTADEKVDRMRIVVKDLEKQLSWAQQTIEKLNRHVHSANEIYFRESRMMGEVEVGDLRRKPMDDDVYF